MSANVCKKTFQNTNAASVIRQQGGVSGLFRKTVQQIAGKAGPVPLDDSDTPSVLFVIPIGRHVLVFEAFF